MDERILNILSMCLQAKEKGHDAFFVYFPHVNIITVTIHKGGWKEARFDVLGQTVIESYEDATFETHTVPDAAWSEEEIDTGLSTIEAYLKELIA